MHKIKMRHVMRIAFKMLKFDKNDFIKTYGISEKTINDLYDGVIVMSKHMYLSLLDLFANEVRCKNNLRIFYLLAMMFNYKDNLNQYDYNIIFNKLENLSIRCDNILIDSDIMERYIDKHISEYKSYSLNDFNELDYYDIFYHIRSLYKEYLVV